MIRRAGIIALAPIAIAPMALVPIAIALATLAALALGQPALGAAPRASLTDIENEVMCVSCREPLALAQSPQAIAERDFISRLIAQGETKQQIEKALLAQYGPAVLGRPPAHGFNLTVYLLPPAVLIAGVITLAIVLPRWRRARRDPGDRMPVARALAPEDAARLKQELARFDGY